MKHLLKNPLLRQISLRQKRCGDCHAILSGKDEVKLNIAILSPFCLILFNLATK